MPSTTDDELRQLLEKEQAEHEKALARIAKRGGLPIEADISAVYKDLNRVFDRLESLAWRVNDIVEVSDFFVLGDRPPFPVTLEHIGVLTVIADDVEERCETFLDFAKTFRASVASIDSLRRCREIAEEQKAKKGDNA
jgi:hypothetical protein